MGHEIVHATAADFLQFYSRKMPFYVLRSSGIPVVLGGFWDQNGERWAVLDVRGRLSRSETLTMIRNVKAALKNSEVDVLITADTPTHPTAPKLLKLCGFKPTERILNGLEVWKYVRN